MNYAFRSYPRRESTKISSNIAFVSFGLVFLRMKNQFLELLCYEIIAALSCLLVYTLYKPLDEIGERQHNKASYDMSVGDIDGGIHAMVEGSFCDDVHESVAYLTQNHEKVRPELEDHGSVLLRLLTSCGLCS